ncbi:MAG: Holliday junction resolvase RuvX [Candidatus Omnitrophota bacterium]
MRIIALDVGEKRIGVAVSDPLGIIAQGLKTVHRKDDEQALSELRGIIAEKQADEVVVGLPLNMNGSHGPAAKGAVEFADRLKKGSDIKVTMWDERLSTSQIERHLLYADISRAKRRKVTDMLAAQVILQSYLDSRKREHNNV